VEIKKRRRRNEERRGGGEGGQERTRTAEKRVRRFTSLYATHLLHIDSLSGRLFSRVSSLNTVYTYTRREHECARVTRTRAGERSPRLNYRLYVFKWSAVCIFIKVRERQDLHHSLRPLHMPISWIASPPDC